jgi:hypothetical protein
MNTKYKVTKKDVQVVRTFKTGFNRSQSSLLHDKGVINVEELSIVTYKIQMLPESTTSKKKSWHMWENMRCKAHQAT